MAGKPALTRMVRAFWSKELAPISRLLMIFAALNLVNGIFFAVLGPSAGVDPEYFQGSTVTLLVFVPGMFGHVASFFERKRRHLILLRSLPVGARFIVWMKLLAGEGMALLVTAAAAIPLLLARRGPTWHDWILIAVLMAALIASLLVTAILFRNEIARNLPFFVLLLGTALTTDYWTTVFEWVNRNGTLLLLAGVSTIVMAELAAALLRRRELDW